MTMTLLTLVNPDNLTKQNINCMQEGVNYSVTLFAASAVSQNSTLRLYKSVLSR